MGPWEAAILLVVLGILGVPAGSLLALGAAALLDKRTPRRPLPVPGQRWAIDNGPTVEVLRLSIDGATATCRYPDGSERALPSSRLASAARLLPADDAVPQFAAVKPTR